MCIRDRRNADLFNSLCNIVRECSTISNTCHTSITNNVETQLCKIWHHSTFIEIISVVTYYLNESGVMPYLTKLGFDIVGYGCMTCIGNSGTLPDNITQAI